MREINNNSILVDYYAEAYGPTIHIGARSVEALAWIKDLFEELAAAKISEVDLNEVSGVKVMGIKAFVLRHVPGPRTYGRSLRRIHSMPEGTVFLWAKSTEGWLDCAGLLDGLLGHGFSLSHHQYLTHDDIDDAVIEVYYWDGSIRR